MPAETNIKAEDLLVQQQAYINYVNAGSFYDQNAGSTISKLCSFIAWDHNSGEPSKTVNCGLSLMQNQFNNNRQFIKLEKSFLEQLENYFDAFNGKPEYFLLERMKVSADAILKCSPDKISIEVTEEGSIFYTFLQNDVRIYLQHFLLEDDEEMDEAIVSIYKDDENILNYAGSLISVVKKIHSFLIPNAIALPELAF